MCNLEIWKKIPKCTVQIKPLKEGISIRNDKCAYTYIRYTREYRRLFPSLSRDFFGNNIRSGESQYGQWNSLAHFTESGYKYTMGTINLKFFWSRILSDLTEPLSVTHLSPLYPKLNFYLLLGSCGNITKSKFTPPILHPLRGGDTHGVHPDNWPKSTPLILASPHTNLMKINM